MNRERRSLIVFICLALALVVGAFWIGDWMATGGPTKVLAKPGQIAFISDRAGASQVWMMNEDGSEPRRLNSRQGEVRETVFSPEGDWVYFTGQLETEEFQIGKVRPNGKALGRLLATSGAQTVLSVSRGAKSICYVSNTQVFRCSPTGTDPEKVLPSHGDEGLDPLSLRSADEDPPPMRRYSIALINPTNSWIAAISQGYDNQRPYLSLGPQSVTASLADSAGRKVIAEECGLAWSADGKKLALTSSGSPGTTFLAVYEPDPNNMPPGVPVLRPARTLLQSDDNAFGIRNPAWSADGKTIVFERIDEAADGSRAVSGLMSVPADGGVPKVLVKGQATNPKFSPDGRFMLYQLGNDLMRYEWKTGKTLNLTKGQGLNRYASWSPVLSGK